MTDTCYTRRAKDTILWSQMAQRVFRRGVPFTVMARREDGPSYTIPLRVGTPPRGRKPPSHWRRFAYAVRVTPKPGVAG